MGDVAGRYSEDDTDGKEIERLVLEISAEFINLPVERMDQGIQKALERIASSVGADRSYIFLFSESKDTMDDRYEWTGPGVGSFKDQLHDVPVLVFPWFSERILNGKVVLVPSVNDLPPDANPERKEFEREGIRSLVNVPIISEGDVIGFIGFDSTSGERAWPQHVVDLLRSVGEIVGNAISRKGIEDKLRLSEGRYKNLFDNSPQGIAILDLDGRIVDYNRTMERLNRPLNESAIGMDFRDLTTIDPERMPRLIGAFMDLLQGRKVDPMEVKVDLPNNAVWLEVYPGLIEVEGDVKGIQVITNDITQRKMAETERDLLFFHSVDPQAIAGFDGYFKMINPAWVRCLGWDVSTLLSSPFSDLVHPEDAIRTEEAMSELRDGKAVYGFENRYRCADGSYRWLSWNSFPLRDRNLILIVARDVTERKQYEERIEAERNRAEFYLDLLSHDIGNIHQGISSWTFFALDAKEDGEKREMALGKIDELQRRALKLVKNVLLISRLKSMKLDLVSVDLVSMARKSSRDVSGLFPERRIDIEISGPEEVRIQGETLISEIFFNMMQNSFKFIQGDEGMIDLTIEDMGDLARIRYSDNGPGIPDELKKVVLSRLNRDSRHNNTGIGLSLVKELVERYGGTMRITDRVQGDYSQGVCFIIDLPKGS